MKRFLLLSLAFVSVTFMHSGCGFANEAGQAEKYADEFHTYLKKKDVEGMMSMVHADAMATEEEGFRELLTRMSEQLTVKKIEKKMGFNTSINNGISTVTLNYIIHDKNHGEVKEEIVLRDTKDGKMKVIAIEFNQ